MSFWDKGNSEFSEWFVPEFHTSLNHNNSYTQHWHINDKNQVKRCKAKSRDSCKFANNSRFDDPIYTHFPNEEWAKRQISEIKMHEGRQLRNRQLMDQNSGDFGALQMYSGNTYEASEKIREFFEGKDPKVEDNFITGGLYFQISDTIHVEAYRTYTDDTQEQFNYPTYALHRPAWIISEIENGNTRKRQFATIRVNGGGEFEEYELVKAEFEKAFNAASVDNGIPRHTDAAEELMSLVGQVEMRASSGSHVEQMFFGGDESRYDATRGVNKPGKHKPVRVFGKLSQGVDERTIERTMTYRRANEEPFTQMDVDIEDDDPNFDGNSWRLTRGGVGKRHGSGVLRNSIGKVEFDPEARGGIEDNGWAIELGSDRKSVHVVHPEQAREVVEDFVKQNHPHVDAAQKGKLAHDMIGYAMRAEKKQIDIVTSRYQGLNEQMFGTAALSEDANRLLSRLFS